ncbi:hypothetical protein D9613_006400 [Agrocybe pediades]|uniref:Nephrocystin 3-like N-terminal domain-containing protein n=1 Tax=Agrocybe pediades TaxID=84607 RepID=A0A8H4VRJ3_9AGAR|nr:hypothetical protein D9613_006400 [Agrocybe pediades]
MEAVATAQCRAQLFSMQPPHSTPMITSDRGVLITGGQFIQQHYHGQISVGNKAPIDILTEAVATNALHDSGASFDKPKCHPRTRVKIREIIMRWIELGKDKDDQTGKQFMWFNGAAGCGKSAIAQSTVETCIEQGLPLASFFFSKSDSTRNHPGSLVGTLAYQLYCAFPRTEVQKHILSVIQEDPLIFSKTLQQQFTSLIIRPLVAHFSKDQSIQQCVPFLIVIDGLDECTDHDAQKAILTGLADSLRGSNLYIPILVASRPEHEIKLSFGSKSLKDIHTVLSLDLEDEEDAYADIRLYLFDRFAEIKDDFDNRTTGRKLAQDWPGDEVIEMLVKKSSRQFVYAATVICYVESTRHRPDRRLDVVLNLRLVHGDHPFAELDELYATILKSALDIEKVLHVLALHLMDTAINICCPVIEKLLSYDEGEVEILFCDMGALVQVYKEREQLYLRFLHASFREYLVDATRSKQFHINMDYEFIRYVTQVLQYLASHCSSSFDPTSIAATAMYILNYIQSRVAQRIGQITISFELRQAVFSFPLKEFLEPHTSTPTYPHLLRHFITPFVGILENIVSTDPTLSYIQDHQLEILQTVLLQQLQPYFNDDRLALVLALFYHLGSHRFVPVLMNMNAFDCYSTPFYLLRDFHEGDVLSLSRIWDDWNCSFGDSVYHRFVRQLLCDTLVGQTTEYTLGPIHARAALACFKELASMAPLLPLSSGKNIDIALIADDVEDDDYRQLCFRPVRHNAECNFYANLVFDSPNGGQWLFIYSEPYAWKDPAGIDDEELYFILVGYLIFLLPRCGRLDALVAACQDYTWLPDNPKSYLQYLYDLFPVRRTLFHKEINKYLARVSPNIMSEPCI